MKKYFLTGLIILATLFQSQQIKASHFAGAELTYKCLGNNTYQITLIFYRDCSGIAAPTSAAINVACSSNSAYNFSMTLNKIPGTGQEITNSCSSNLSKCNGGNNFGISEYIYQGTATLVPCNHWIVSYSSCCRNPITTASGTADWYIVNTFNNLQAPCSSAPVFIQKPKIIVPNGQLQHINYGAIDPNGDSLVYSLFAPFKNSISSINYLYGYSFSNFLNSSVPITLNSATGVLTFKPNTNLITATGIKIEKYRTINGTPTKIGTVYRDVELKVVYSNNHAPVLSGMDFLNSHHYNNYDTLFYMEIGYGNSINFDINAHDIDTVAGYKDLTIHLEQGIQTATFTTHYNGTDSAYAHFSWTPTMANISNTPYDLIVSVRDSACPYFEETTYRYRIKINSSSPINLSIPDTLLCSGDTVTVYAQTQTSNPAYHWKWNGNPLSVPLTQDHYLINTASYPPGIDTLSITIPGQGGASTTSYKEIIINHIYQPHITGTLPDSAFCTGDTIIYDAGQANSYKWTDNLGNIIGTNQTQKLYQMNSYQVYVEGGVNTRCTDADTFLLITTNPPIVNLGNDTTITNHQNLTLNAGLGTKYIWSTGDTTQTVKIYGNNLSLGNNQIGVYVYNIGCAGYDEIKIFIITGIDDMENSGEFVINPNPNNGEFLIALKSNTLTQGSYHLEIYSSDGKIVFKEQLSITGQLQKTIKLNNLGKGLYYIKIYNDKAKMSSKFIIE